MKAMAVSGQSARNKSSPSSGGMISIRVVPVSSVIDVAPFYVGDRVGVPDAIRGLDPPYSGSCRNSCHLLLDVLNNASADLHTARYLQHALTATKAMAHLTLNGSADLWPTELDAFGLCTIDTSPDALLDHAALKFSVVDGWKLFAHNSARPGVTKKSSDEASRRIVIAAAGLVDPPDAGPMHASHRLKQLKSWRLEVYRYSIARSPRKARTFPNVWLALPPFA